MSGPADISETVRYHPADRFWDFQVIETAILALITAVLLAIAWRLVLGLRTSAATTPRLSVRADG